ncbi:MAG: addiction module protein [Pseudomonadales bacterium]|nr:addiction module protein [Pseudomonadales bacterium]
MSEKMKQLIESIRELSSDEKALLAHCLIASLEMAPEDGVDEAWLALAEKRYFELESGVVKGVSWQEIKATVQG